MPILQRLAGAAAVAALAVSTVSIATPAHAAPGDTTLSYAPVAVLGDLTCIDHAYTYNVELPAGPVDWTMTLEVIAPDGSNAFRQSFGTFNAAPSSGSAAMQLCAGFEQLGTYTIATTTDYKAGTANTVFGTKQVEGTLELVDKATSKVSLKAKRKGKKVTATASIAVTVASTTSPVAEGGQVTFQKKVGKKWKKVAKATTDASGKVKAKFKARKGDRVRAVFAGAGEVVVGGGSLPVPAGTSKPVKIK
jgi:hypothetical protein